MKEGYFTEFDKFCRYYPDREEHLSRVVENAVRASVNAAGRSLRILDVGSADGRLLRTLLSRLDTTSTSITCLEPCPKGFQKLQKLAPGLAAQVEFHEQTLEAWLSSRLTASESFDLVLCSHVHYHFENPTDITNRLADLISPKGVVVVIIDSHDSPLYHWLDTNPVGSSSFPTSRYGGFFGFEHLRAALQEQGVPLTSGLIDSSLNFPSAGDFNHAVAFLSRRTVVEKLAKEHRPRWADTFPCQVAWREGFIVLHNTQPKLKEV